MEWLGVSSLSQSLVCCCVDIQLTSGSLSCRSLEEVHGRARGHGDSGETLPWAFGGLCRPAEAPGPIRTTGAGEGRVWPSQTGDHAVQSWTSRCPLEVRKTQCGSGGAGDGVFGQPAAQPALPPAGSRRAGREGERRGQKQLSVQEEDGSSWKPTSDPGAPATAPPHRECPTEHKHSWSPGL